MGMKGDKPKAKGKRKKAALNRLRTSTKKIREDFAFKNPRDRKGAAALELRKRTLGEEFATRGKANVFLDRRETKGGPVTDEEKMWDRLVKHRQQLAQKKSTLFDLKDDEDSGPITADQSLGTRTMPDAPEPTEGDDEAAGTPKRKLTRQERLYEVVVSSKMAKLERQVARERELEEVDEVDAAFDEVAATLATNTRVGAFRLHGKHPVPEESEMSIEADKPPEPVQPTRSESLTPGRPKKRVTLLLPGGETIPLGVPAKAPIGATAPVPATTALPATQSQPSEDATAEGESEGDDDDDEDMEGEEGDEEGSAAEEADPMVETAEGGPAPAPTPAPAEQPEPHGPTVSVASLKDASFDDLEALFESDERTGRASGRTPTPDEVVAAARASLDQLTAAKAQRMKRPTLPQDTHGERDTEPKDQREDEELLADRKVAGGEAAQDVLALLLADFETGCKAGAAVDWPALDALTTHIIHLTRADKAASSLAIRDTIQRLYEGWQLAALQAKQSGHPRALTAEDIFGVFFAKLVLMCYPASDYRHPMCTPLALWLTATLTQDPLHSGQQVALALFRLTLVLECCAEAKRFCTEALPLLCALLSLACPAAPPPPKPPSGFDRHNPWLPYTVPETPLTLGLLHLPPSDLPRFPSPSPSPSAEAEQSDPDADPDDDDEPRWPDASIPALSLRTVLLQDSPLSPLLKAQLLKGALQLTALYHRLYCASPSYPELVEPLLHVLRHLAPHAAPLLRPRLDAVQQQLQTATALARAQRRPLASQMFRPVPLKLYDPMVDLLDRRERVQRGVHTRKDLQQEHRKATRQAIKAIRADTRFLQSAREAEWQTDDDRRTKRYNQIISELQEQRHMVGEMDTPWHRRRVELQRTKAVTAHVKAKEERQDKIRDAKKARKETLKKFGRTNLPSKS